MEQFFSVFNKSLNPSRFTGRTLAKVSYGM